MDVLCGFAEPTYKHVKYVNIDEKIYVNKNIELTLCKGEKFAFQLILCFPEDVYCSIDNNNNLNWRGLTNRARVEMISASDSCDLNPKLSFLGYVPDDSGLITADPILNQPYVQMEARVAQSIWVEGTIPDNYSKNEINYDINIWFQKGFEEEEKLEKLNVKLNIENINIPPLNKSDFFLDLWQHPSNWARAYEAGLWSKEHFDIIDSHIKELGSIGAKVVTLIVSEIPWSGQSCFNVTSYPSNLFEHNMVRVTKNKDGEFICDFSIIDKYINICNKYGIKQEIDLVGLTGVWSEEIGNPLEDYDDSIRVRYYDENDGSFKYIKKKSELKKYMSQLFNHLIDNGWWDKTRVLSDEPRDVEKFKGWISFINSVLDDNKVKFKTAVDTADFVKEFKDVFIDWVPILDTYLNNKGEIYAIKDKVNKMGGLVEWYVCCHPDKPNNFIKSPLIESKIMGWLTYYFGLDGFLRWDYAIWPDDPWNRPGYRYPFWKAGDMFFIYPGKNGKPVRSIRWENLRLGIQDYNLFKLLEKKGYTHEQICSKYLKTVFEDLKNMKSVRSDITNENNIYMDYSMDYWMYDKIRKQIIKELQ